MKEPPEQHPSRSLSRSLCRTGLVATLAWGAIAWGSGGTASAQAGGPSTVKAAPGKPSASAAAPGGSVGPGPAASAPLAIPLPGAMGFVPAAEADTPPPPPHPPAPGSSSSDGSAGATTPSGAAPSAEAPAAGPAVPSPYPPGQAPPPPPAPWPGYGPGPWGPNPYGQNPYGQNQYAPNPYGGTPYGQQQPGGYGPYGPPPGYTYPPPGYGYPAQGYPPGPGGGAPGAYPGQPSPYGPPPGYPYQPVVESHSHTGLFLGVELGGGYDHVSSSHINGASAGFSGGGFALDLALGGAIVRNVLLFGALGVRAGTAENFKGALADRTAFAEDWTYSMVSIGGGLRYYLEPSNFFLQGVLTFPQVSLRTTASTTRSQNPVNESDKDFTVTKTGVGLEARVGKEWWVSASWGLGVSTWLSAATLSPDASATATNISGAGNSNYTLWGTGLAFSATYN